MKNNLWHYRSENHYLNSAKDKRYHLKITAILPMAEEPRNFT